MKWKWKKSAPDDGSAPQNRLLAAAAKRKKVLIPLAIVLLLVIAFVVITGNAKKASAGIKYTEVHPEQRKLVQSLSGDASLAPADSYTVRTGVSGDVLAADFEEGDNIEKDQVLYEIDSSDVSANVEKADIQVAAAQRSYKSTSEMKYITADSVGTLSSLKVKVGQEVAQGDVVATIHDSSRMTLKVPFASADALTFHSGQGAVVLLDGTFEELSGVVSAVSSSDVLGTGNLPMRYVTIVVANPGTLAAAQGASAVIDGIASMEGDTLAFNVDHTVVAKASGRISAVKAQEGSRVGQDTVLAVLDSKELDDKVQTAAESLRSAELSRETTQKTLDKYTITSPIKGTVVKKSYKVGDSLTASNTGTELCQIYDLSYLEVELNVDELDIANVSVGQSVEITADAVENKTYQGVVTNVSVAGTTTNGVTSYPVTIRIDKTEGLLPGMNVTAEIVVAEADNALSIPSDALQRGNIVLVTAGSPSAANALSDRKAPDGYAYVKVEVGLSNDEYVEITAGLTAEDTIAYVPKTVSSGTLMQQMQNGGPGGPPSGGHPGGM